MQQNKKQTHRYRKKTSGYQWGEGRGRGKLGGWDIEIKTAMYKIDKQQKYIEQHRELQPLPRKKIR